MKEHEFKISHDKATGEWMVWVKVPFMFFWSVWQVVFREKYGIYGDPFFKSEEDCHKGIAKWMVENSPGYERYQTKYIKGGIVANKVILEVENGNKELGLPEKGLISFLMGEGSEPVQKPTASLKLAQQAVDFWVEEWEKRGVEISSAILRTEFDPEDAYWYFVIELLSETRQSVEDFVDNQLEIIMTEAEDEATHEWMVQFTVITRQP